jgi:hypothetical protein
MRNLLISSLERNFSKIRYSTRAKHGFVTSIYVKLVVNV